MCIITRMQIPAVTCRCMHLLSTAIYSGAYMPQSKGVDERRADNTPSLALPLLHHMASSELEGAKTGTACHCWHEGGAWQCGHT